VAHAVYDAVALAWLTRGSGPPRAAEEEAGEEEDEEEEA
jgi:hypothetical protein